MAQSAALSNTIRSAVLNNYQAWKGRPSYVLQPPQPNQWVDPRFGILVYRDARGYTVYATAGASAHVQPNTEQGFPQTKGVRYEYIMHGREADEAAVVDVLNLVTIYPFAVQEPLDAGSVIKLGSESQALLGGAMTHLYVTYPYEDDPQIYTPQCRGQIKSNQFLVQTMWVIPIHPKEATLIATSGPDSFEALCTPGQFPAFDLHRPSLVP